MLTLSVVIPVLNDAELLESCLTALDEQTIGVEVIVVDNGSTDGSDEVAIREGALLVRESTPGIPAAAAAGMDAASTDLIARIDTDTLVPPDWAERVVAAFADPAIDALTGPGEFYGSSPLVHRLGSLFYMRAYFASVAPLVGQRPVFGSNYAIRRAVWADVRARVHERSDVHDDMDLSFQLDGAHTIRFDPALTVKISARPITSIRNLAKHYWLAIVTIAVNWRERGPWRRWGDRRRAVEVSGS